MGRRGRVDECHVVGARQNEESHVVACPSGRVHIVSAVLGGDDGVGFSVEHVLSDVQGEEGTRGRQPIAIRDGNEGTVQEAFDGIVAEAGGLGRDEVQKRGEANDRGSRIR